MNNTLPQGFTARLGSMDDLEAVYELMAACDLAHYDISKPDYTSDDIRSDWQVPGHDMTTDNWVVLSPEGRIVGSIGIWHRKHVRILFRRVLSAWHPQGRLRRRFTELNRCHTALSSSRNAYNPPVR